MMRIYVKETYRGEASSGRLIERGEYDLHDLRLFNAAGYLVEFGFAEVVVAESPVEKETVTVEDTPGDIPAKNRKGKR